MPEPAPEPVPEPSRPRLRNAAIGTAASTLATAGVALGLSLHARTPARRLQPGRRAVHAHRRPGGLPARAEPRRPDRRASTWPPTCSGGRRSGSVSARLCSTGCTARSRSARAPERRGVGVEAGRVRVDSLADWSEAMSRGLVAVLVPACAAHAAGLLVAERAGAKSDAARHRRRRHRAVL